MDTRVPTRWEDLIENPDRAVNDTGTAHLRVNDRPIVDRPNVQGIDGIIQKQMMLASPAGADARERSYDQAVGLAVQYGILVYCPGTGGRMKPLDTLRNEIEAYEIERGLVTPQTRHRLRTDGLVQAYCTNGHPATVWGSPIVAEPGQQVRWRGAPTRCRCQALIYGSRR